MKKLTPLVLTAWVLHAAAWFLPAIKAHDVQPQLPGWKAFRKEPDMKKPLSLGLVVLFAGITTTSLSGSQDRAGDQRAKIRFVGVWRLVSLEAPGPYEKIQKANSIGMFVFTRDGHASVQVMERNPSPQDAAGPGQYSQGGYEATFGTYEVDESAHTFTFHVEGALVRNLIGKDLLRSFEFAGNQLIVKSTRLEEQWKVTWERY